MIAPPEVPRLRMTDIRKRFGMVTALRGVSLEVGPGEVHALIGENGAGKSTMMKILSGALRPDEGSIQIDGQGYQPANPQEGRESGIAMVYQELTLAPDLTVSENIVLGSEPHRFGWIQSVQQKERAVHALTQLKHLNLPLDEKVRNLSVAQQQIVEIARALLSNPKVLVLDEPTSSLTRVDTEALFTVINRIKQTGVSIVYISHFLEECRQVASRFTVLRDGSSVGSGSFESTSQEQIIEMMVGRSIAQLYPRLAHELGEERLIVKNLKGISKPSDVNFSIRTGEIVGVAGLVGSGRTETLRVLFGLDKYQGGVVTYNGKNMIPLKPRRWLKQGVGMLSENRKEEGLLLNRSLTENLTLTKLGPLTKCGFISPAREQTRSRELLQKMNVKFSSSTQPVQDLSGGNQQKVAIGRLIHHEADLFLLDEPTRGIDVGSKSEIYLLIQELAAAGKSVLFISSYLPELLGVCDRIAVMNRGKLIALKPASEWTEHSIMTTAIGAESDSLS
ncbi:MAG: sugar ABC transporter ATP-binding protein [Verrucomicrobiota bacterium]|nr:sugar ABC transporter ATP-binding protein [Verrucomicrobiota bacterium]